MVVEVLLLLLLLLLRMFLTLFRVGLCGLFVLLLLRLLLPFLRLGGGRPCCVGWPGAARGSCLRRRLSKGVVEE